MMPILTRKLDMMVARKGMTSESSSWRVEIDERQTEHAYVDGYTAVLSCIRSRGCYALYGRDRMRSSINPLLMNASLKIGMTTLHVNPHHVISNFSQNILCEDL